MRTYYKVVVLLLAALIAMWKYKTVSVPSKLALSQLSEPNQDLQLPKENKLEIYQAAREPIPEFKAESLSESCVKMWNELRGMNLTEKPSKFPDTQNCNKLPSSLNSYHQAFLDSCLKEVSSKCEEDLYRYRAALSEYMTKDTPLNEINDPKLLTDKMLANLQAHSAPAKLAEVAERLLEVDPSNAGAARASILSRLQDAQTAKADPNDPRWKKLDEALERAQKTFDDPFQYLEAKLYAENLRDADPQHFRQSAAEVSNTYLDKGIGPYHEAWAEMRLGNKERAIELLNEAIKREPLNTRYRLTLDEIKKDETLAFRPSLTFNWMP